MKSPASYKDLALFCDDSPRFFFAFRLTLAIQADTTETSRRTFVIHATHLKQQNAHFH